MADLPKRVIVWGLLALVTGGIVVGLLLPKSEKAEDIARMCLSSITSGNGSDVYPYVHISEKDFTGLTRENLGKLSESFLKSSFAKFRKSGDIKIDFAEGAGFVSATQKYVDETGFEAEVVVRAYPTQQGITCSPIVSAIVFSAASTQKNPSGQKYKAGTETIAFWAKYIDENRAEFESLGLKGFKQDGVDGKEYTWDQWIQKCHDAVKKAESAK